MSRLLKVDLATNLLAGASFPQSFTMFRKCQKGTAVVEHSLIAAFIAGSVLSGSSYISHDAEKGENALLGVFVANSTGSSGTKASDANSRNGVMITE